MIDNGKSTIKIDITARNFGKTKKTESIKRKMSLSSGEIECPIESLKNTIPFDSMDWSTNKRHAWIYGIVVGWDEPSLKELSGKFNWNKETVARLRRLHKKFNKLEETN